MCHPMLEFSSDATLRSWTSRERMLGPSSHWRTNWAGVSFRQNLSLGLTLGLPLS